MYSSSSPPTSQSFFVHTSHQGILPVTAGGWVSNQLQTMCMLYPRGCLVGLRVACSLCFHHWIKGRRLPTTEQGHQAKLQLCQQPSIYGQGCNVKSSASFASGKSLPGSPSPPPIFFSTLLRKIVDYNLPMRSGNRSESGPLWKPSGSYKQRVLISTLYYAFPHLILLAQACSFWSNRSASHCRAILALSDRSHAGSGFTMLPSKWA